MYVIGVSMLQNYIQNIHYARHCVIGVSFIFTALQFAQLKKIKRFVKHAEFQNMLYSNASRSLVDYYLIINDRGQFIYKDERIDQRLFLQN